MFDYILQDGDVFLYETLLENPDLERNLDRNDLLTDIHKRRGPRTTIGTDAILEALFADPHVDPDKTDGWGSPILITCRRGHPSIVRALLAHPRVRPHEPDNLPLLVATYEGHTPVVSLLLADPRVDPQVNHYEPYRVARWKGYFDICQLLLLKDNIMDSMIVFKFVDQVPKELIIKILEVLLLLRIQEFGDPEPEVWKKKLKDPDKRYIPGLWEGPRRLCIHSCSYEKQLQRRREKELRK